VLAAISKLLNFDKALVLDMYIDGVIEDLRTSKIGANYSGYNQATDLLNQMRTLRSRESKK
jgi:hypothetical protein